MKQGFKFYGDLVDPDKKKILYDAATTQLEKNQQDLKDFHLVYENQIAKLMRSQEATLVKKGLYKDTPSQIGAYSFLDTRLFATTDCIPIEISLFNFKANTTVFAIKVRFNIGEDDKHSAFGEKTKESSQGFMFATFYIGLCDDFTSLVEKNADIERAITEAQGIFGKAAEDPLFMPEQVLANVLKHLRAKRLYRYVSLDHDSTFDSHPLKNFFYKTPEGIIFRTEINGYAMCEEIV